MNHKSKNRTNGLTANRGPIQEAIWGDAEIGAFIADNTTLSAPLEKVLADSIACLQRNKSEGKLYGEDGKITQAAMDDLGRAGFWGVLVPTTYGGSGASFAEFTTIVTRMAAAGFATEAGIAGMHGCIGAVSSLTRNGNDEQKARYLPLFAAGLHTSGLALTEPGAGSDVMKIKTTAYRDGDDYVISGEKLFNGNCVPGRIIRLVVMVDGEEKPAEFIVELPEENEHFQLVRYKILAVRQGRNNGLKFNKFRVPAANRIIAPDGNGLRLIYIGLNFGRVAVAANCAGIERLLLRSICPWANYRETYGQRIETRERVKAGIARLAALIVGTDAARNWCSIMLDNGETAELECIIAKTFAADALKEAAIDIALMIHGGRAFLGDHIVGANLHDYLAPCIYEGQNDMLNMKFFLTLGKEHIEGQLKPLNKSLTAAPGFALWNVKTFLKRFGKKAALKGMDARLAKHVQYALSQCPKLALEISNTMLKHGAKLGDRQSRVVALSQRVQDCIVMLVTASHAHSLKDEASIAAADVLCRDLKRKLTGEAASDADFAACNKLADLVIAGEFKQLHETEETPVLRPYKN